MKRRLFLIILLLAFIIPVGICAIDSSSATTLKIHYYRYGNDYGNDWNLWIWPQGGEGERVDFDKVDTQIVKDDFGAVATINLTSPKYINASRIGILVRRGEWIEKDIALDRYITVPTTTPNGILDVYLVEGDERMGYSLTDPNGPDKSDKIKAAYFTKQNEIAFKLTTTLTSDKLVLFEDTTSLTSTITVNANTGKITLNKNVDFGKTYLLQATFTSGVKTYQVTFDGIYDSPQFEAAYGYEGNDLGSQVLQNKTTFKLWAPISSKVMLNIYSSGTPQIYGGSDTPTNSYEMIKDVKGTWKYEISQNLHGKYYTYSVTNGSRTTEVIDPYAKSAGVNGIRGMIVDFTQTNPTGYTYDSRPNNITNATDAIIYELHVRDLSTHSSWNGPEQYRGKFLGLTVEGTNYQGVTTGLDHIKELGVTHVQLLPIFDFGVVDETKLNDSKYNKFNWGYMPMNFNVPEGSYSTDPYDGVKRVTELKQTVQALSKNNIGVIMDVVYNHTGPSADSNFNIIVPGYYHRLNADGSFSNGSGTGNETASERYMMRKFMIESLAFWAKEYNLAGFRFDLMALHDVETMNQIVSTLKSLDPEMLIFGEPWNGGSTPLSPNMAADKVNMEKMPHVGAFNDDFRDGVKGSVFTANETGFVQGNTTARTINRVKYGVVGGINYPGLSTEGISYNKFWHTSPEKTINYVSAHDNNTLYDKLRLSTTTKQKQYIPLMQQQANAIVMTSQGVVFMHAGAEFMRSKPLSTGGYDHNSYESPDSVNQLRWDLKAQDDNKKVFEYYKGLIELRKAHPAFRMTEAQEIIDNVKFVYTDKKNLIAYTISNYANNDTWGTILVIHNNGTFVQVQLPEGEWNLVGNSNQIGTDTIKTYASGATLSILEHETMVLYSGEKLPETKKGCFKSSTSILTFAPLALTLFFFRRKKELI